MSSFAVWTIVILFGSLFVYLIAFRWPVFLSMIMACATWGIIFPGKLPDSTIVSSIAGNLNSVNYIAIIFYFLLGELLNNTSLADRLCRFLNSIIGHIPGSLSHVNVLISMIFAGISGSSVADTSSIGSILIPMMKKEGYPAGYAAAVTEATSLVGPIIPPSNGLVMCAIIFGCSVRKLFIGGLIPGIILGLAMLVISIIVCKKKHYPCSEWRGWKYVWKCTLQSWGALALPILVITALMLGIGTVVEIGAVSCLLAIIIDISYGDFSWKNFYVALRNAAVSGATVMAILAVSGLFSWILASAGVTAALGGWLGSLGLGASGLMALCMVIFFVLGFILDPTVLINVIMPLMMPALLVTGVDLTAFCVLAIITINLGNITPPVGALIYLSSSIAKCSSKETIIASIPYFLVVTACIVIMILFPQIITFLPNLIMG